MEAIAEHLAPGTAPRLSPCVFTGAIKYLTATLAGVGWGGVGGVTLGGAETPQGTFPIRHRAGHPRSGGLPIALRQRRGHLSLPRVAHSSRRGPSGGRKPPRRARALLFRSGPRRRRHGEAALRARIGLASEPSRGGAAGQPPGSDGGTRPGPAGGKSPGWGAPGARFRGAGGPGGGRPRVGPGGALQEAEASPEAGSASAWGCLGRSGEAPVGSGRGWAARGHGGEPEAGRETGNRGMRGGGGGAAAV